jgi:bis(5'-nucleosyl)-tetraphosphatase (symmetrical)
MSTFAIGDLQGCFRTLQALLEEIQFHREHDRLWFVGDLVNRGPDSLACLRFVRDLGERAVTVLGNHDLHLLAAAEGLGKRGKHDTLAQVLEANDANELILWLRQQKLIHVTQDYAMVHAGLLPEWSWVEAQTLAREVEEKLAGPNYLGVLETMYGNEPAKWEPGLRGEARMRITINAMTRLRVLNQDHVIDFKFKGALADMPTDLTPWFAIRTVRETPPVVITGHWSALDLYVSPSVVSLDTGCVWGRKLTAMRLEDGAIFQVANAEFSPALGRDQE